MENEIEKREIACIYYVIITKRVMRSTYLVTLKTRRRRTQRKTDTPKGGMTSVLVRTTSTMLLMTTKQSKRLNSDTK